MTNKFTLTLLLRVIALISIFGFAIGLDLSSANAESTTTIRYLCLPLPQPQEQDSASIKDIATFLTKHKDVIENSPQECSLNLEFGRSVIAQTPLLNEVAAFQRKYPRYKVQIRFIQPQDWLYQTRLESQNTDTPIVAQIGDSWLPFFQASGKLISSQRFYYDLRLIWYKPNAGVHPTDFSSESSFYNLLLRLRSGAAAPLVISTARDANLLWTYFVFQQAKNGSLIKVKHLPFYGDWTESTMWSDQGSSVTEDLAKYSESGCLALPTESNIAVTNDFLKGNFQMSLLEPWVAFQAAADYPEDWQSRIEATLPPNLGNGAERKTFIGGSMLAVFGPPSASNNSSAIPAERLANYLCSPDVQSSTLNSLCFIPATDGAWKKKPVLKAFFDKAMGGTDNSNPSHLEYLRTHGWSPPASSEPSDALENASVIEDLSQFWSGLAELPQTASDDKARSLIKRSLIMAQTDMNENISPGVWWCKYWAFLVVGAVLSFLLGCLFVWVQGRFKRAIIINEFEVRKRERTRLLNQQMQRLDEILAPSDKSESSNNYVANLKAGNTNNTVD